MSATHYVVVSADNSPYVAWQAKLFHYSCLTRTGATPLIVVHGPVERDLDPGYHDIARMGGVICRAGSYRASSAGGQYAPRNTPGTLLSAADFCESPDALFVLCDPDMIFVRKPDFPSRLSGDHYDYLNYEEPSVQAAARRLGVTPHDLVVRGTSVQCGVPHVVPAAIARPFAETWLDAIDLFPTRGYVDSMYAFGLAATALELDIAITRHMVTNHLPDALADADMIHYCYGDARWNKRDFVTREQVERVWSPAPGENVNTVLGELLTQLTEAGDYYAGLH